MPPPSIETGTLECPTFQSQCVHCPGTANVRGPLTTPPPPPTTTTNEAAMTSGAARTVLKKIANNTNQHLDNTTIDSHHSFPSLCPANINQTQTVPMHVNACSMDITRTCNSHHFNRTNTIVQTNTTWNVQRVETTTSNPFLLARHYYKAHKKHTHTPCSSACACRCVFFGHHLYIQLTLFN